MENCDEPILIENDRVGLGQPMYIYINQHWTGKRCPEVYLTHSP